MTRCETAPRSPLSRARPALAVSTSVAAPLALAALAAKPSATAADASSYAAIAASASPGPVPNASIAAGDTSCETSTTGPKARPGTTGVPRSGSVTMTTSKLDVILDSQHIRD